MTGIQTALFRLLPNPGSKLRNPGVDPVETLLRPSASYAPAGDSDLHEASIRPLRKKRPAAVALAGVALRSQLARTDHVGSDDPAGSSFQQRPDLRDDIVSQLQRALQRVEVRAHPVFHEVGIADAGLHDVESHMPQRDREVPRLELAPPGGSHRLAGASVVALLGGRQERDRRDLRTACGAGELE